MRISHIALCTLLGAQQAISGAVRLPSTVPTTASTDSTTTRPKPIFSAHPLRKRVFWLFDDWLEALDQAAPVAPTPSQLSTSTVSPVSTSTVSPVSTSTVSPALTPTASPTSAFSPVYSVIDEEALKAKEHFDKMLKKASEISGYDIVKQHPGLLPNASVAALKYQPVMDFKRRSCYNAAAISSNGTMHPGMEAKHASVAQDCRNPLSLLPQYNNVYVRRRCNHGWCAWMYDYYFPKDVMTPGSGILEGHRHEWENVVVWAHIGTPYGSDKRFSNSSTGLLWQDASTQMPKRGFRDAMPNGFVPRLEDWVVEHVSLSYHGGATWFSYDRMLWDNSTHPKIIYTKQGLATHIVRPAGPQDDTIWNVSGKMFSGTLVEWDGMDANIRSKMCEENAWGSASVSIGPDTTFEYRLKKAVPEPVFRDGFNVTYDIYDKIPQSA